MSYYIQCPHCKEIIEVNYKPPRSYRCRTCRTVFRVTKDNSCPKPRIGIFYALSLIALYIGACYMGSVFRGYSPESYLVIALAWMASSFGITLLTSWYERTTERSIEKYGCSRSKRSVPFRKSDTVERPHNRTRI